MSDFTRFLLAKLHLDSLIGKRSPKAVRTALARLPTGSDAYDHAYRNAMERIEGQVADQVDLAKQVISWITCAVRPLTTAELRHALAVEVGDTALDEENQPEPEDMISVCAGLVTIEEQSGVIRLVHYTTQEYFKRNQTHWFPVAELTITQVCITYLSFAVFSSGPCEDTEYEERVRLNPFYLYAAQYWGDHARRTSTVDQDLLVFLQDKTKVEVAYQALLHETRFREGWFLQASIPCRITGLHLAAWFGLEEVTRSLLRNGIESTTSHNGPPLLLWAAVNGYDHIVKLLLDTGGGDLSLCDLRGWTALHWAVEWGHRELVKLLLDAEQIEVDVKSKGGETPLHLAAEEQPDIVKLLLDTGNADPVSNPDIRGWVPLHTAARYNCCAAAKLLLDTGKVDVNTKCTKDGKIALTIAAWRGNYEMVNLLLSYEPIDPDPWDNIQRTPLWYAAKEGNEEVLTTLLRNKAVDPDMKDFYGVTALSVAIRFQRVAVVQHLLDTGHVEIASNDQFGNTLLWYAGKVGNTEILGLLLEHATQKGISVAQGDIPMKEVCRPATGRTKSCDVCTFDITLGEVKHHCDICNGANFDICVDCYEIGARCLEPDHRLIPRQYVLRDGEWQLELL